MIKTLFSITILTILLCFDAGISRAETSQTASALKKLGVAHKAVFDGNEPEKALSLLENLENEIPELREYVFFIRAAALEKSGDPFATEMYRRAASSEILMVKALEKEAAALEKNGLINEAEERYKTLLELKTARRKDFYLKKIAEIAEKKGFDGKAAEIWELLWREYPTSIFAGGAAKKITELGTEGFPSIETAAARADRLFELRKWKLALTEYETLPETPRRNFRRAVCLYMTGKKDSAKLEKALFLLEDSNSPEGTYRKGTVLERMAVISGGKKEKEQKLKEAKSVFKSVHDSFPGSKWAAKALIRAQMIALKYGKTGDAEKIYLLIKKSYPLYGTSAAWNLGWTYYKMRQYTSAVRIFSENRQSKNSVLQGRFAYWTAKIFEKKGLQSKAQDLFVKVASQPQFSYYSFLAAEKTGHSRAFPKRESVDGTENEHPGIERARLLIKAGIDNWAEREARAAGKSQPVAACEIFAAVRNFQSCIKLVGSYPPAERIRLSFPKGFEKEVKKFSAEYGLDEMLVYSLIREESRFRARAVSHANAFGLMQLIMPTAKEVAEMLKMDEITREKLFIPEVNIKLGSRYLAKMLKKFKGDRRTALSAYNAGPSRVGRWINGPLKNLEPDEFTEDIPFAETRNYVRRIFRSYGVYTTVYGRTDG